MSKCPICRSDTVFEGKIIWMGEAFRMMNDKQPIDYHCFTCNHRWREKVE